MRFWNARSISFFVYYVNTHSLLTIYSFFTLESGRPCRDFIFDYGPREFRLLDRGCHGSLTTAGAVDGTFPVQAAICIGVNPVVGVENSRQVLEALKKIPFVVSLDLYMTPTAEMADIVLPISTWLERDHPHIGTNRRSPYFFHTEFRQLPWLRELEPEPLVEMNPETAKTLGIRDGEWVYVETRQGTMKARATLTSGVHPRVVCARHGWWFPEKGVQDDLHEAWESNLNVLTRNDRGQGFDPLYGCPQLRGFLCRSGR